MERKDVEHVVRIHLASFPGFFLSFLGPRFLDLYYSSFCVAPEGFGFVYLNPAGIPAGFVVGTSNPRGFYTRLLKQNWLKLSMASLDAIWKKPTVVLRLARAIHHPSQNPMGDDIAGLLSIGITPELQGTGAGKKLVKTFLLEANKRGCRKVFLTTDRDNNNGVNSFYQNLGFHIERQFETSEGRRMNEYRIDLPPSSVDGELNA